MKHKWKSAFINTFLWPLLGVALTACDTIHTPHIYGPNEVPKSVVNAPRPFTDVDTLPANEPYPKLDLMPYKPHNFSTPSAVIVSKQQLELERQQAAAMKDDVVPATTDGKDE